MSGRPPSLDQIRIADLSEGSDFAFSFAPDNDVRQAIAKELGLIGLRKLRLDGKLCPQGRKDWRLEAKLGATVSQACVVSSNPVTTRIDEPVLRHYLSDPPPLPEGDEIEMPEDDTTEPLPPVIMLEAIVIEALALSVPQYPREDGAVASDLSAAPPGSAPMKDEETRPFASLAALRDRLENNE